jgi:predicted ATPase
LFVADEVICGFARTGEMWGSTTYDSRLALATTGEALALADETGEHWSDAFLHRVRGEILLKLDSTNTLAVEESFLSAIGIAQQQKARSLRLRAAFSLATLYHSTGRFTEAHTVLAPALEGFVPTQELPEIEEARALLETLSAAVTLQ